MKTFLTQPIEFPCWAVLVFLACVVVDGIAEDGWRACCRHGVRVHRGLRCREVAATPPTHRMTEKTTATAKRSTTPEPLPQSIFFPYDRPPRTWRTWLRSLLRR
jgi:hypothetical protein